MNTAINNKKNFLLGTAEIIVILLAGFVSGDVWYKILISVAGMAFNFLVSCGKRYGFIVGVCYAAAYAVMAYTENVYASAVFMLFIQLPMGIVSFTTWKSSQSGTVKMQKLSLKNQIAVLSAVAITQVLIYILLNLINSSSAFFDSFFFATSLISCILLAKKKKEAYIIIMLSGIAGTLLWLSQFITTGDGISVLILNFFVLINSVKGLIIQNKHKLTQE